MKTIINDKSSRAVLRSAIDLLTAANDELRKQMKSYGDARKSEIGSLQKALADRKQEISELTTVVNNLEQQRRNDNALLRGHADNEVKFCRELRQLRDRLDKQYAKSAEKECG